MMTVIVGRRSNSPLCTVKSTAVPEDEQCQEFSVPAHPGAGGGVVGIDGPLWIKYVQGVVALMNSGGDVPGFEAVVTSCVPLGGGVSSSASLEVAVGLFVEELLGRELPRKDLALVCQQAEHRYAGIHDIVKYNIFSWLRIDIITFVMLYWTWRIYIIFLLRGLYKVPHYR